MNKNTRDDLINSAINKLSKLTGEDFHGYRSEVWNLLSSFLSSKDEEIEKLVRQIQQLGCNKCNGGIVSHLAFCDCDRGKLLKAEAKIKELWDDIRKEGVRLKKKNEKIRELKSEIEELKKDIRHLEEVRHAR